MIIDYVWYNVQRFKPSSQKVDYSRALHGYCKYLLKDIPLFNIDIMMNRAKKPINNKHQANAITIIIEVRDVLCTIFSITITESEELQIDYDTTLTNN